MFFEDRPKKLYDFQPSEAECQVINMVDLEAEWMLYIYNLRILSYDLTGLIIAANYLD